MRSAKRIEKEYQKLLQSPLEGMRVELQSDSEWHAKFVGAAGSLYDGEEYTLRIRFGPEYPIESPEVVFLLPAPVHPHIYSNGHICLNILYEDWTPALTVQSICLSLISMLSSATVKVLPPDNDRYVRMKDSNSNPKKTLFAYHDDSC
jgi:ubiquitin-conjugating enzyme E2 W